MADNQQASTRKCVKCDETKELEDFAKVYAKSSRGRDYRQHTCLACYRAYSAEKERIRRAKYPERYKKYRKDCRARDPEKARRQRRESGKRLKDQVFNGYGGYVCKCCGETSETMLTIDHVDNDGKEHRSKLGEGKPYATSRKGLGDSVYRDLRNRGFPEGFQVLCYNCNVSKHRLGKCEHTIKSEASTTIRKRSTAKRLEMPGPHVGEDIV